MITWLRWVAVLPASVLAFILSLFVLRFVLYQTLTGSGLVEPYPEFPERTLTPLVGWAAFIWSGAWAAPKHKFVTALVLFSIWLLTLVFILAVIRGVVMGDHEFYFRDGGVGILMSIIGAFGGLFIVDKQYSSNLTKSGTTIILDIVRHLLIIAATGYFVFLIWQWNSIVALLVSIPIYIVAINLFGFLTLPLYYYLTPEFRLARRGLKACLEGRTEEEQIDD